jgi:acyl-coenzyme A synthetase/AMP-(fatty) acid ligase
MNQIKSERFGKVSRARTDKIKDMIRLLGNCSNKNNYAYSKEEAKELFDEIQTALDEAKENFEIESENDPSKKYKKIFESEFTWLNGFMRNVMRYNNKKAVVFPLTESEWTYQTLNEDANRLANALLKNNVDKKDVILHQLNNSPAFVFTYIACHKIGAVNAPVNFRLAPQELAYIIDNCSPEVFVFESENIENVRMALSISKHPPRILIVYNSLNKYDENKISGCIKYEDFVLDSSSENPVLDYSLNMYDETTRLFTSGSTGKQKGVVITSINEILSAHDVIMHLPMNCTDITMNMTPWFHRGGLHAGGLTPTLYSGGTVVIMPHFDAKLCLKYVEKYKLTYLIGVPTVIEYLARMQKREGYDLSSLNGIIAMGSPLNRADCIRYQKLLTPNIFNGYGTTETFWNTFLRPFDLPDKAGTAGISCVDDDVRVVKIYQGRRAEPDDLALNDDLEIGEIIVKSPAKSAYSYSTDEEEKRSQFYKGYLYTNDVGTWDENHYITLVRRKDEMINSSGENINPEQVESVIKEMNGVRDCAVTSVLNKVRGEMVVAYIVRSRASLEAKQIDNFCIDNIRLANYKRPRYYRFVQQLPETLNRKVNRLTLKQMAKDDLENGLLLRV